MFNVYIKIFNNFIEYYILYLSSILYNYILYIMYIIYKYKTCWKTLLVITNKYQ